MSRSYLTPTLVCIAFSLSCLPTNPLAAQDFYGDGVSARTVARAGVYVPDPDNVVDALSLNPAGLTALGAPVVNLNLSGILARGNFSNSTNANSPMRLTGGLIPSGGFGTPIGHKGPNAPSNWTAGFAIAPQLLSSSKWNYRDSPGIGGANYGLQRETSAILAYRTTGALAYAITPFLSVGATIGLVYNSNTLAAPFIFQSNPQLQGLKTLLDLHTHGTGWDGSVGVRVVPVRKLELGLAYKTGTSITSSGTATGNMGAQFAALGIPFQPTFSYHAQVVVHMPQSALTSIIWQATSKTRLSAQADWTGWKQSFQNLPVRLTKGTNSDINSFLHSNSLKDLIPLSWKDQVTVRVSADRLLTERLSVSGGFLHGNNPVPSSTLSPLTAAIMKSGLATGFGYRLGRFRFDLAYGIDLTNHAHVGASALRSGEYSNSDVRVGTQALTLSTTFHL